MMMHTRRHWGVGLVAGLVACGVIGAAPANAQTGPMVIPPTIPIAVGITPGIPSVIVGIPGNSGVHSQGGVSWSTTGRADVDVDIDRQHGQATAR